MGAIKWKGWYQPCNCCGESGSTSSGGGGGTISPGPTPNDGKTEFFYKSDTEPRLGYSTADQPYDNAIVIPGPNDGQLTFKDHEGNELGVFTADQDGDTEITLPQGFSGDYEDLTNKPDIFDGKFTIKDSEGNILGEFTANQEGDTEVILPAGDGAGLDCDGVADCLVNVPVDAPKYAFSLLIDGLTSLNFHSLPPAWPAGHNIAHLYFELCDPDDHHLLTLGEEGHGFGGGDYSIYRLPASYVGQKGRLAICAPPPVYADDREVIYGFHPDILHVNDLNVYTGVYKEGVTTTEQLWTEGDQIPDEALRTADGHIRLPRDYCYGCSSSSLDRWKQTYFRVEFTCHRGDTYHYVFILYDVKPVSIPNPWSTNPEIEEVNIEPMEDN